MPMSSSSDDELDSEIERIKTFKTKYHMPCVPILLRMQNGKSDNQYNINIKLYGQGEETDFTIYVSNKSSSPCRQNCDKSFYHNSMNNKTSSFKFVFDNFITDTRD